MHSDESFHQVFAMKKIPLWIVALLLLSGCGATYTKVDPPATAKAATAGGADECPDGIDYKTGRCR
jgi:uncharacterized protein YceK